MRIVWFLGLAVCVVLWTYAPAFGSYLVADDFQWMSGAMGFSIARLFDVAGRDHFYRPIVELYFAVVHGAFGCSARALHAASIAVHLVNAGLVMALAFELTGLLLFAGLSGLLFAAQPAPAEAILWPSAITTLLATTFGLAMLIADARRARENTGTRTIAVAAAFAAALGCHESSVMFLPAAMLLRYARDGRRHAAAWLREYGACVALLAAYTVLTAWINSRNYVVTEGHYTFGSHVVSNLFRYLVALYAGHRRPTEFVLVGCVCTVLLIKGSPQLRAWTLWMLIALLPVLPFSWGTSSRYLYIPAIPFSFLVARGIMWLLPLRRPIGAALLVAVTLFIVVRSSLFGRKGSDAFRSDASRYEAVAEAMRQNRSGEVVSVERTAVEWIKPLYVTPLARTAVCDSMVVVDLR